MSTSPNTSEQTPTITSTTDTTPPRRQEDNDTISTTSETQNDTSFLLLDTSEDTICSERTSDPPEDYSPNSTPTPSPPSTSSPPNHQKVVSISVNVAFRRQDDAIATWDEVEDATQDPELRNFFLRRLREMFHEIERCILPPHENGTNENTNCHTNDKDTPVESSFHRTYWRDNPPKEHGRKNDSIANNACTPQAL